MLRRHLVRALVGSLAVLLQLAASAPLDLNLCIAEDGHAGLEVAHGDGDCLNEVARHHPQQDAFERAELDHHPCRDLSLDTAECGPGSASPRPDPPAVASAPYLPPPAEALSVPVASLRAKHHPPDEAHLRTIILLV